MTWQKFWLFILLLIAGAACFGVASNWEMLRSSFTAKPLATLANSAAIIAALAALFAVYFAYPWKPNVSFLQGRFDHRGEQFYCKIDKEIIEHRTCYLHMAFKNEMNKVAIKPRVCIEVPRHLLHMNYLYAYERDPWERTFPLEKNGMGPDGGLEVRNHNGEIALTARTSLRLQDQEILTLETEDGGQAFYADIPFVPAQQSRAFWVRIRIPQRRDPVKDVVLLHLSVPFLQRERCITWLYFLPPYIYERDQDEHQKT